MSAVSLQQVTKVFRSRRAGGTTAVRALSLEVADGELLVLMGASGAGKTTVLRLVAGLETPDAGEIRLYGRPMAVVPAEDRGVAMVFQDHPLLPHLTVGRNLGFGLRLQRRPAAEIAARVEEVADLLNLQSLLGRQPSELSGGERQRVALGTALVRRPRVMLLDEPLAQLDASLRFQLRREIRRLHRRLGVTMILVTHDPADALALGDRLAVLEAGELLQLGTSAELYRKPVHLRVAMALGAVPMNLLRGRVRVDKAGWLLEANDGSVWRGCVDTALPVTQSRQPVCLGIRPEKVRIHRCANGSGAVAGARMEVEALEFLGAETLVCLRWGGMTFAARCESAADLDAPEADGVWVTCAPDDLHWFDGETGRRL